MKILKYKKQKKNLYTIITDKDTYELYDDVIIKYELLLKKEIDSILLKKILALNNLYKAYYESLKAINIKMRCEKEIKEFLTKKNYNFEEISFALDKLIKEGYLKHQNYIEAYIHDALILRMEGPLKIKEDLLKLGFKESEITPYLKRIDKKTYLEKIDKYVNKKLKTNKKSSLEFKRKILNELMIKGFSKEEIIGLIDNLEINDNEEEIKKIVNKLFLKYQKKYDLNTTKYKIKAYLYYKGYHDIDLDKYLN